eukprot:scaffold199806_cov47-Attheya_sp.AAC.1
MMRQLDSPATLSARVNDGGDAPEELESPPLSGAKIVGSFEEYDDLMRNKHKETIGAAITEETKIIVLDSYDGAEHSTTSGKRKNVISFSSQVFCRETVASGVTTAGSFNILTWQQVMGEEKCSTLFPVLEKIFEEKTNLMERKPNISIYEMHDDEDKTSPIQTTRVFG